MQSVDLPFLYPKYRKCQQKKVHLQFHSPCLRPLFTENWPLRRLRLNNSISHPVSLHNSHFSVCDDRFLRRLLAPSQHLALLQLLLLLQLQFIMFSAHSTPILFWHWFWHLYKKNGWNLLHSDLCNKTFWKVTVAIDLRVQHSDRFSANETNDWPRMGPFWCAFLGWSGAYHFDFSFVTIVASSNFKQENMCHFFLRFFCWNQFC